MSVVKQVVVGLVVGILVGFLIGSYVTVITEDYVIRQTDQISAVRYQETQSRYRTTLLLAFGAVFAATGPVVASASFGPWLRHAVYGFLGTLGLVVGIGLTAAAARYEQPFNQFKFAPSTCIDTTRNYGVPAAVVIGPVVGMLVGMSRSRQRS